MIRDTLLYFSCYFVLKRLKQNRQLQIVVLMNPIRNSNYPELFRRIRYYDAEHNKRFVFLEIFY
jgi:hypothetical protein